MNSAARRSLFGRAVLALLLTIGFYGLALAIAFGLLYLIYLEVVVLGRLNVRLTVFALIGAIVILWAIFPRVDKFIAPGPRLSAAKFPELFKEIEKIARATRQELPREVYLISDVNAFVAERGGLMGIGSRRVMGIGLPLFQLLRVDELNSILAHEFGHFHGGDTALGPWIYKTRAAIIRTVVNVGKTNQWLQIPFEAYARMFLRVTNAVSRQQEFTADQLAARTVGARAAISGLQKIHKYGPAFDAYRDFRSRIFQYTPASQADFDPDKASLPFDQIFAQENISSFGFKLNEFTNNQDKYFGVSILNGMFGMFDNKFGIARLVWGVRVENFQQFLTTKDVTSKRVNVLTEKWDLLPSLNLTLSPNTKNNIRFSGSRTVARPEFREIAPFSFYDYEVNYAVNGNPDLTRTSILNADARYEFYPKGGEAISLGIFYKDFRDPIELRLDPSSVLDRRNYGYGNAEKAYSAGVEFEVRKSLSFIDASLAGFNLFSNLTYIYSKVTLQGSTTTTRPLQGQSPYLVNVGLQYNSENGGWSGSALYNRMGQRLALVGNQDFPDIYERPRDQVDIQIARKILKNKGEIKLTWADLLNQANYLYENVDAKKAFKPGSDRLFNSYRPGSTISIGFTYDFNIGKNNK